MRKNNRFSNLEKEMLKDIGEMCGHARKAKGLSLADMSILAGITRQGLDRFEKGITKGSIILPLIYEAVTNIDLMEAIISRMRRNLKDYYDVKSMSGMMVMAMKKMK